MQRSFWQENAPANRGGDLACTFAIGAGATSTAAVAGFLGWVVQDDVGIVASYDVNLVWRGLQNFNSVNGGGWRIFFSEKRSDRVWIVDINFFWELQIVGLDFVVETVGFEDGEGLKLWSRAVVVAAIIVVSVIKSLTDGFVVIW